MEGLPVAARGCHAAPPPLGNVGRGRVQNLNQSSPDASDGNQDREGVGGGCRLACGCWPVLPRRLFPGKSIHRPYRSS